MLGPLSGRTEASAAKAIIKATQPNDTQNTTPRLRVRPDDVDGVAPNSSSTPHCSMAPSVRSGTTNSWVKRGQKEVHREVDDDVGDRGDERHALDHEVIAVLV